MPVSDKPNIAIISNVQTPYRVALHKRFIREIPEVCFHSLYTHGKADQPWATALDPAVNPVSFAEDDSVDEPNNVRKIIRDFRKSGRMIQWLTENRVRAVFLCGYNDIARLRLFRWCRTYGVPVFLVGDSNVRGDHARGLRRLLKQMVVSNVVRWSLGVLPFGSAGARYFFQYGADHHKIIYCPCEPDYDLIEQLPNAKLATVVEKYKINSARKRLLFCGRMAPVKRPDMVVKSFAAVAEKLPDWDLVMIGSGQLLDEVKALVPEGLRNRVTFTGFIGDQAEIAALYRLSHVLLIPSEAEPWGLVVNEAAAAGMAVVASSVVGAAPELVRPKINGAIFEPGDLDGMLRGIMDVCNAENLQPYRDASRIVLGDWRRRGDPVIGMRLALARAGLLIGRLAGLKKSPDEAVAMVAQGSA